MVAYKQVGDTEASTPGQGTEEYRLIGGGDNAFPHEYSVGGWFKWNGAYSGWHSIFRLTINNKTDNQDASRLGDRVLNLWVHPNLNFYPATYSYTTMNMEGDANKNSAVSHGGINTQWHHIYYGYSKIQKRAYFQASFKSSSLPLDQPNTNHYWSEKFWFLLKDSRYPWLNG